MKSNLLRRYSAMAYSFLLGIFGTSVASASSFQGNVTNVTPFGAVGFIVLSPVGGFDGGASSCYASQGGDMVYSFDLTSGPGKALLATVLAAKVSGKIVYVYGASTCQSISNPYNGRGSEIMMGVDLKG